MAISKIYSAIERYVKTANKVRANINTMPLKILIVRDAEKMDEWITKSVFELENIAIMTEMFFCRKDRTCFNDIVEAAQDFKVSLHKAFSASTESARLNIYDSARVDFNKRYDSGMKKMIDMLHDRILGEWEYDLTGLRLNTIRGKRAKQKRNQ